MSGTGTHTGTRPGSRTGTGFGASVLLGAGSLLAGVALTATSGWLIVRAAEQPVVLTLLTAIVAVRAFGIARPVLRYAERVRSHDVVLHELADRRASTYAALVPLTPARLGRRRRSDVLTCVVDDLTEVVESRIRWVLPVASAGLTLLAAAVLAALLDRRIGLTLLALGCVAGGVLGLALVLERRAQVGLQLAREEVNRVAELVGDGIDGVRAVGAEPTVLRWLDDAQHGWDTAVRIQSRGRAVAAGLLVAAVAGATAVVALLAAVLPVGPPVRALLVLVPVALLEPMVPLADAVRAGARATSASTRLAALLAPGVDPAPRSQRERTASDGHVPHLALRGVTASWSGNRDVGPVDLDLPAGSWTVLTGPNGGGKSTLLAMLADHLRPTAGSYLVDGISTTAAGLPRGLVAVVDDEPHVLATTLRQNLRLAAPTASVAESVAHAVTDSELVDALREAGLGDWWAGLADGLDTRLGTGGRGLSGGERTRLSIARALVSRRPVILLDEPVAHLDHATAVAVLDDLHRATRGHTVVVASHQPIAPGDTDDTDDVRTVVVSRVGLIP